MAENPPYTIDNPTTVKENLVTKAKGNFDNLYALLEPTALKGTATDAAARVGLEHSTLGAHTVDVISEKTAGVGVTIDGVKCKDSIVYTDGITEKTGSNDVPFSVPIKIDVIKEKTATSGVTIDGGLLKDGDFVANAGNITSFKATAAEVYAARGSKASIDARLDVSMNEDGTPKAFPVGTVMAFFQAAAPTGWTQVVTHNNKMLRVVSGVGGGSGGTISPIDMSHTHTGAAHMHTVEHIHRWYYGTPASFVGGQSYDSAGTLVVVSGAVWAGDSNWCYGITRGASNAGNQISLVSGSYYTEKVTPTSSSSGAAATSSATITPYYIDMILASKD